MDHQMMIDFDFDIEKVKRLSRTTQKLQKYTFQPQIAKVAVQVGFFTRFDSCFGVAPSAAILLYPPPAICYQSEDGHRCP